MPPVLRRIEAQRERNQMLRPLASAGLHPALCSANEKTFEFEWSFPVPAKLEEVIASHYEGVWLLMFFSADAHSRVREVKGALTDAALFEQFALSLGAQAAILSFVDDVEWLFFIN